MGESKIRQFFHRDTEAAINTQINMELHASYVYLSMAYYFDRDDVALQGLRKYFEKGSIDERDHALKFMEYMNKRGGRILLTDIKAPERDEWGSAEEAMTAALELEKSVNAGLMSLHKIATTNEDANLCDFLETDYLLEQIETIKEMGELITNLQRVGEGIGLYMFDKDLK